MTVGDDDCYDADDYKTTFFWLTFQGVPTINGNDEDGNDYDGDDDEYIFLHFVGTKNGTSAAQMKNQDTF